MFKQHTVPTKPGDGGGGSEKDMSKFSMITKSSKRSRLSLTREGCQEEMGAMPCKDEQRQLS
jgi:hypothetical protein